MVTLASEEDSKDLATYLQRAEHLGCEHVWLIGAGKALAAYTAVLTPQGILDRAPTVLGLRVCERLEDHHLDTVVQIRAVLDRLAHDALSIPMPVGQAGIIWSGVAPPRSNWQQTGTISEQLLEQIAQKGIEEVAQAQGLGTQIVQKVRTEVWQRPIEETDIPSGVAFAGFGLGFLADGQAQIARSGSWTRVTTERGHILVK